MNLPELLRIRFYIGMPAERWDEAEIDALEAKMHAKAIGAGDTMKALAARIAVVASIPEQRRSAEDIALLDEGEALAAHFASIHTITQRDAFTRDFLIIATPGRFGPNARAAAVARLADLLKSAQPYRKNKWAWRSLYRMAGELRIDSVELLRQAVESAIERAVIASEEFRPAKQSDGKWIKRGGRRVAVRAARQYGIATRGFFRWFERTVRNVVEEILTAAPEGEAAAKPTKKPSDDPPWTSVFTPKEEAADDMASDDPARGAEIRRELGKEAEFLRGFDDSGAARVRLSRLRKRFRDM